MLHQVGAEQAADNANVRLEHGHINVAVEIGFVDEEIGDTTKFGKVSHHSQRVQRIGQRQRVAAPRIGTLAPASQPEMR